MIILIRHGQSEGNKNRDIHQFVPDHRVRLTPNGHSQAEEAGHRLRSLLKADDKIMFFTSPYRRTRETTEGILKTLTGDDPTPSPFLRHQIKVYEEPRLREQDFGNFQPCSAEMERMWQERADYGHFFYRIPNGESAADAYDRISGFNESLWRQFGEDDFPSVCVLVTHGLMTRVFLMKWYHWSVEYFEDLRNINHCEFIIMNQNQHGKYKLDTELRTWSELKRRADAMNGFNEAENDRRRESQRGSLTASESMTSIPERRWGGCVNGCNHASVHYPRRTVRKNTADYVRDPATAASRHGVGSVSGASKKRPEADPTPSITEQPAAPPADTKGTESNSALGLSPDGAHDSISDDEVSPRQTPHFLKVGRDFGGSRSGVGTPAEVLSDDSDYFDAARPKPGTGKRPANRGGHQSDQSISKHLQEWVDESGMGTHKMADKLGDGEEGDEDDLGETADADALKDKDTKSMSEIY